MWRAGAAAETAEGNNGEAPVDPDALFEEVLDGVTHLDSTALRGSAQIERNEQACSLNK